MGHPHPHTKPNLYECGKVQRSQIFKQNQITGWVQLIQSHSLARFCFELSGNSN